MAVLAPFRHAPSGIPTSPTGVKDVSLPLSESADHSPPDRTCLAPRSITRYRVLALDTISRWDETHCEMQRLILASAVLLLLAAASTTARAADSSLTCPTNATRLGAMEIAVHLENDECVERDVRVLSTVVGNRQGVLSDVSVFGPRVIHVLTVPAASDQLPGTCDLGPNRCDGSSRYCESDADCICRLTTPSTLDLTLVAPQPYHPGDPALQGMVLTHILTTEWQAPSAMESDHCHIELPEPSLPVQLASALVTLAILRRVRSGAREARPDAA